MFVLKKKIKKHYIGLCCGIIGISLVFTACNSINKESPKNISQGSKIISGNNELGFKLMKEKLNQEKNSNCMISPMSLCTILALTHNGAGGETKSEILKLMGIDSMTSENINKEYNQLMQYYNNQKDITIKIANSAWLEDSIEFNKEFKRISKDYYNAEIDNLDFKDYSSVDKINNWVDENTNGKIPKIIKQIKGETIFFLINALYFNGKWEDEFDEKNTEKEDFTLSNGEKVKVDMMKDKRGVLYLKKENFAAVSLPYSNNIEMNIFLPDKSMNIDDFINKMDNKKLDNFLKEFNNEEVKLQIPKFKFECGGSLTDNLKKLGMVNSFDAVKANFKGLTDNAYISDIIQKCYISTDEKGTEAAAVTVVEGTKGCPAPSNKQIEFIVNRPFVFIIRDNTTGLILFMGKVEIPEFN